MPAGWPGSGRGKSTLLSLVSGLAEPTGGVVTFSDLPSHEHLPSARRNARVGIVFQFPERHFLGRTVLSELTFGWPTKAEYYPRRRGETGSPHDPARAVRAVS